MKIGGPEIFRPIRGEFGETLTDSADGNTEPSAKPSLRRCRDYLRQNGLS